MENSEQVTCEYKPQSYKNNAYRIFAPASWWKTRSRCRLRTRQIGNCLEIEVTPDAAGEWQGLPLSYSGLVDKISGEPLLALAHQGSWSGGANWSGYVFCRPGDVVQLNCKGKRKFIYVVENAEIVCQPSPPPELAPAWEAR